MKNRPTRPTERNEDLPAPQLLSSVAFWQGMCFLMLIAIIWVNEVLDLAESIYGRSSNPVDWFGASLLSAGVVIVGFITVAHTYVQQTRALRGFLVVCAHCRKVRAGDSSWTNLEHFVQDRTKAEFTHGLCPDCYETAIAHVDDERPPEAAPPRKKPARKPPRDPVAVTISSR